MPQFASIFLRGNPFLGMSSVIRYYLAKDEEATVLVTERLGRSRSPLTVDELLSSLRDPRFNVRFEAIVAIARMKPDARLTEALVVILHGNTPALSVIAAWALGRMGDTSALGPLRDGLDAPFRSIQAQCARSLGTLHDQESAASLLNRLEDERADPGLRMSFASALGKMRVVGAADEMLSFLYESDDDSLRAELTLALARIVGDEAHFIRLFRQTQGAEVETALSQAVSTLKKPLRQSFPGNEPLTVMVERCAEAFARNDMTDGVAQLHQIIDRIVQAPQLDAASYTILRECGVRFAALHDTRVEYVILALHTMHVSFGG